MPSQVRVIVVIVYGSLLNLLSKPWSSSDSMLERRRNDLVAILLWICLFAITMQTVLIGIADLHGPNAFDLQDWTALVLPFALAAPYLLELFSTLIRQLEMWQWMRRAAIHALPIAWMYRTMTVGEEDADGKWLRNKHWAPWDRASLGKDASNDSSFWNCTSRHASLFSLYRRWLSVLVSALRYSSQRAAAAARMRAPLRVALSMVVSVNVLALTVLTATMLGVSLVEVGLLMAFDYAWWRQRALRSAIIARYDTVHFGREELQLMFEYSEQIRSSLRAIDGVDACALHNRVMGAVVTTAAVLENAFRRAYLVTPVYEVAMSNRRALRDRYAYVGCDLDMLIKQVRLILEHKHTSGLMSIASTSGTIEASLHNNIESILSVAIFFEPLVLYNVTSRVAALEAAVERRLSKGKKAPGERVTRERVVYIDARNAVFWLLWTVATRDWHCESTVWSRTISDRGFSELASGQSRRREGRSCCDDVEAGGRCYGAHWIDAMYVVATFLSRCRYCARFGMGVMSEEDLFKEVRSLCATERQRKEALRTFSELSDALLRARGMTLLAWTEREYGLRWVKSSRMSEDDGTQGDELQCTWKDDAGSEHKALCTVTLADYR